MRETLAAIRHLEEAVLGARWTDGIVLRYGAFYGPGTSLAPGEEQFELIRKRRFPLVGDGGGVWSFIHVADAAEATVAAVEHGSRGVYNVVDDDPAPVAEWLPVLAQTLGAKRPMHVPRFIGRLFAGEAGVVMMTEIRGASNAKAKRDLGWRPAHPSWRQGFAAHDRSRATARRAAARVLRDRLPDARQRLRGRGRRAGSAAAGASRRSTPASEIASSRAFVATVTTRLAINELRSARARRERYVGEWLPEPIVTDGGDDPARHAEMADSLSVALLVLLESLSPEQRAVLLLHDVFDYRVPGDRGDRRQERGQRAPARRPRQAPRRGAPAPFRDDPRAARRAGPAVLRRPPSKAISPGSRRCSPTTWS